MQPTPLYVRSRRSHPSIAMSGRSFLVGHVIDEVKEVVAVRQRRVQMPGQVALERAARDLERVRHVDLRSRGHAADHPGDERAVSFVRLDRLRLLQLRLGQVFELVQGSLHPFQPGMGVALVGDHLVRVNGVRGRRIEFVIQVPQQPRVGDVDGDALSRASGGDGGIGLGPVIHLLRVGRRTRAPFPGHGDDVIGGGAAGTEHSVDEVERRAYSKLRKAQDDDSVDHRLDPSGGFRTRGRYRLVRLPLFAQDDLDPLEIPLEDENLAFGVHVRDSGS